ncbi:MAG: DUF998 domain-containing protein [Acidimicrobiales bacterium]
MSGTVAAAGVVALAGLAGTVASLVYLHLAPTGLSPVRNAVSQYGITRFRGGYRAATISLGVAGAALATGIGAALDAAGTATVVGLLVVFALGRLVISWFPMDEPGGPRSSTGSAHGLIAIVTFTSVTVAALRLGSILRHAAPWHALATASTVLGWAMVLAIAGMLIGRSSPDLRRRFGAVERVLYVAILAWTGVFAVACALRVR